MTHNIIEYKRYIALLELDLDEGIIIGRVINTHETISFHAENLNQIKEVFHNVIDTYLIACEEENIMPSRPYSGKFNLRITPDLHRELSVKAAEENVSLNDLTIQLIKTGLMFNAHSA